MSRFILIAFALTACRAEYVAPPENIGQDLDDGDSYVETESGRHFVMPEGEIVITPIEGDDEEPETDTGGDTGTPENDCSSGPYIVIDEEGNEYEVPSMLDFQINAASASGAIGDGFQQVLMVDATACGGNIVFEKTLFQTTTDCDDVGWMQHVPEVVSGVSYEWRGVHVMHGYGYAHAEAPESSVTGLYWDHEFAQDIIIEAGETFSFWLSVTFGGPVQPEGTFDFRLYPRHVWYGEDDPGAYPAVNATQDVDGNLLSYDSSL